MIEVEGRRGGGEERERKCVCVREREREREIIGQNKKKSEARSVEEKLLNTHIVYIELCTLFHLNVC